jgi:YHS domain-containing protein
MMKNVIALLIVCMISLVVASCEKSEPAKTGMPDMDAAAAKVSKVALDVEAASAAIEQTTCPVMGGKINKDIFVEHNGQKVYFCCKACVSKFQKAPEEYLSKLPQFKK